MLIRTLTMVGLVALCDLARGDIIDLLANPGALPANKPASVQVGATTSVDGRPQNVSITLDAVQYDTTLNLVTYSQQTTVTRNWASGDSVTFQGLSSVLDPTGSFSASYTDFGTPSTFVTTFSFPTFTPTLFGTVAFSGSVSGSVTDGTAVRDGVSYSPSVPNPGVFRYQLFDTTPAPLATFFLDPGAAFAPGPPDSHTTGPYSNTGSPLVVSTGPNGVGSVTVISSFMGSGGNDQYSFSGRWDVTPVPEPSSLALALTGLLGLGALAWKRRR
jgi:hypothetical protein